MGSKKILLVEDDPNFGTVLKDYLALNDYNVTPVSYTHLTLPTIYSV